MRQSHVYVSVLIDSFPRYKCDCTGSGCPDVMGYCRCYRVTWPLPTATMLIQKSILCQVTIYMIEFAI